MKFNLFSLNLLLILSIFSCAAFGGVYCTEEVTKVILHNDGSVYFKTADTCSDGWCQIAWNDSEQKNRSYSLLLAASTADKPITLYWGALNSCSERNATYASPASIQL